MKRSFTDPDLYLSTRIEIWESEIPKCCNRQLISEYLEEVAIEGFSFSVLRNTVKLRYPTLGRSQLERHLHRLKQYIQSGEQLANMNKVEILMKGALLAAIALSSLITIALFIFIPTLLAAVSSTAIPLLIMVACISMILFCSMSAPEYAEISAAKQEFCSSETNLRSTLRVIRETVLNPCFISASSEEISNPIQVETQSLYGATNIAIPSTSSGRGFFPVPSAIAHSLNSLDASPPHAQLQSSMSLSADS